MHVRKNDLKHDEDAPAAADAYKLRESSISQDNVALSGPVTPNPTHGKSKGKEKGKGKATDSTLLGDGSMLHMKTQIEARGNKLRGLREDIALNLRVTPHSLLIAACIDLDSFAM